ncbi:hypothetical protein ACHAWO_002983 [Cyclotella atomus]|uniref:Zeta toxin domain-containing protein n=1 Tax=Cyclotella atomus TaxID=382360 RepID=A0ABD3NMA6_9STRA
MLTILAITGPFILVGLCTNTVITPTESRLGAPSKHRLLTMGSYQDSESSSDAHTSKSNNIQGDSSSRTAMLIAEQKRPNRFSSIDVMANGNISISSAGFTVPSYFSVDLSTEENYSSDDLEFYGDYECVRKTLDYSYHGNYIKSRQLFQDKIITKLLDGALVQDTENGVVCRTPTEPWIVFTAGAMGAGKSHTMHQLESQNYFPLQSYVSVDPDEIRQQFPEFHLYATLSRAQAGERTHKEAGYVTEITTRIALDKGYNVLVDGSLRDWKWYADYFDQLKKTYKKLRIAILYVSAPREVIFERAKKRAIATGRVVPEQTLDAAMKQVPISVNKLAPLVDYFCEIDNSKDSGELTLKTPGVTWESFQTNWMQTCPWPVVEEKT